MIYTASGTRLNSYPDLEPSGLSPSDFIMTQATPTMWQVDYAPGHFVLTYRVDGTFSYARDVVGLGVGQATENMTGAFYQTTTTTVNGGALPEIEINRFEPALAMKPIDQDAVDNTLETLSAQYVGNDLFIGDRTVHFSDRVMGYEGDDRFVMTYGNGTPDKFRGGDGLDTAIIESESRYWHLEPTEITVNATGETGLDGFQLIDTRFADGAEFGLAGHILEILEVERVKFTDQTLALDVNAGDAAGAAYRLYQAAFDRTPDPEGLGYWIQALDLGASLHEIAQSFIDSQEFITRYGPNLTDEGFVKALYANTLNRAPDADGLDYWVNDLETNPEMTRAGVLASFTESAENVTNTEPLMTLGVSFVPFEEPLLG